MILKPRSFRKSFAVESSYVGVYWDSDCTEEVTSIDWGVLTPGSSKEANIFVRNEEVTPSCVLLIQAEDWDPPEVAEFITLSWNSDVEVIDLNKTARVTLILRVEPVATSLGFNFNIIISGVEEPPRAPAPAGQHLVVRGLNNRIHYRIYNASGGSLESWNVVPNGMTCDSPAAAVYSGKLYIVVRGMDGQSLWFGSINLTDNSFSDWTRLSGATPSKPTLVRSGSRVILVVRGMNNRIYYRFYDCISDEWEGWIVVPTGVTCDGPAATTLANELHIVVRGISATNSSMWHGRLNLTTGIFLGWTRLSGETESAPTLATSQTLNKLYLTVRGLNNYTYYNTWNGTDWEGWTVLPSGVTCDSPASTITGDELHVAVRGTDGYSLWHYHINLPTSDHSGWTRISGATPSTPTLTS